MSSSGTVGILIFEVLLAISSLALIVGKDLLPDMMRIEFAKA